MFCVFYFALLRVNVEPFFKYVNSQTNDLANSDLAQLINSSALINLPSIKFTTTNPEINDIQRCSEGPRYLGADDAVDYTPLCFNMCGSVGRVVHIKENQEYYHKDTKLGSGYWCMINQIQCNMNTGYVVGSINGNVCRSKFPNMFGGPTASTITACTNEYYPSQSSVLWDYLNNESVDPSDIIMTDENESLPDGSLRFRCKFGLDVQENPYIPHPFNRFEPLRDICKKNYI